MEATACHSVSSKDDPAGPFANKQGEMDPVIEESEAERIERLGRERPPKFNSLLAEIGFVFSVCMSQVLAEYFVSGFNVILPTLSRELNIPKESATWPASAFSLVVASTLLFFGRLADMYGGYPVYVAGLVWLFIWAVIGGFSKNEIMMDLSRALQGLGPAAFLPTSLMLLGSIYRPGPRKNLIFGIYGACAPLGFYIGIFFSGITAQLINWSWYFWIGGIFTAITAVIAYLTVPSDIEETRKLGVKMDWIGSALIVSGLILVVFAITDSSHSPNGWGTSYIIATLITGVFILAGAAYYESKYAEHPLIPPDLFGVPCMKAVVLALFFSYGVLGVFLMYSTFYMTDFMGATPLQIAAWYTPMAVGGLIISTAGGLILHLLPGHLLLVIAGVAWLLAPLMFAVAPQGANYWAFVFPSMIFGTIGIDITFTITNVFITTSLPRAKQGLAGGVINSVLHLGIAFFLGFGDVTLSKTKGDLRHKYKAVLWYTTAVAGVALFLLVFFVRLKPATSDLTADEKAANARESEERN